MVLASPGSEHRPAGIQREGIRLAFEIKLCQDAELKGMLGGERLDTGSAGGEWKAEEECQERNLPVIVRKWE